MSAPTIKPGTRCECRANHVCTAKGHYRRAGRKFGDCRQDAVRMVTVRQRVTQFIRQYGHELDEQQRQTLLGPAGGSRVQNNIPMCAPCAAYHEAKAGAR